jgi:hypothetical protein
MANGYRIPLTHAARTAESEELQGPLTQQALGHGSDHLQPTGPVLQTVDDGNFEALASFPDISAKTLS